MFKNQCLRAACLSVSVFVLTLLNACSHKSVKPEEIDVSPSGMTSSVDPATSDQGNAFGIKSVHFGYDSNLLDGEAKSILKVDADILKRNPLLRVQIEGHCDQRGGIQYNIALGEKRAKAVEHFLEDLGIESGRISTVSFGKEKPLDSSSTEEAYSKNRRANFVITKTSN